MIKAVIFDLDGTLVDSRGDLADAVNETLKAFGLRTLPDAQIWSYVGEGAELLMRRSLKGACGTDERIREAMPVWFEKYGERLLAKTRVYDGIPDVLRGPERRAVLTNKPGAFSRTIVQGLGLSPAFERVVGGDEGARKPDPGNLLALCASLGAEPHEAMLVGDSPVDIATGAAARVPVCAVSWGFVARAELKGAAHLVDTPQQLASLLSGLR